MTKRHETVLEACKLINSFTSKASLPRRTHNAGFCASPVPAPHCVPFCVPFWLFDSNAIAALAMSRSSHFFSPLLVFGSSHLSFFGATSPHSGKRPLASIVSRWHIPCEYHFRRMMFRSVTASLIIYASLTTAKDLSTTAEAVC